MTRMLVQTIIVWSAVAMLATEGVVGVRMLIEDSRENHERSKARHGS
jgi:hypothetical protein